MAALALGASAVGGIVRPSVATTAVPCEAPAPGAALSFGMTTGGILGQGTPPYPGQPAYRSVPAEVADLGQGAAIAQVATGGNHALALSGDGRVWAWGANDFGQLGDGSNRSHSVPGAVGLPGPARAIAAGDGFSLAALRDGTVWAWGRGANGALGYVPKPGESAPAVPNSPTPVKVPGLAGVVEVAAGQQHALARGDQGEVWAWGSNAQRALGVGDTPDWSAQPLRVLGLPSPATALAAAYGHSLAVVDDGSVWGWGSNGWGVVGSGPENPLLEPTPVAVGGGQALGAVATVATGYDHSLAVDRDGRVWAWGANRLGQLGQPSDPTAPAVWGPAPVPGVAGAQRAAAGWSSSLAVTAAGELWAWGDDSYGQLGVPPPPGPVAPTKVPGLDHVQAVAAGAGPLLFSLAVRSGGSASLVACTQASPQSATVGAAFAHPLAVQARDASGAPAPGVAVSFTAPGAGPSARFATSPPGPAVVVETGPDGVATAPDLSAGEAAGTYRVTATAPGYEGSVFEFTNAPGPADSVVPWPATTTPQHTRITTAFPARLAVRVTDAHDNAVAVQVAFAVHPAGGAGASFDAATQTATAATDPATAVATAPPLYANGVAGSYTVTATVPGASLADAVFELTNDDSVPAALAVAGGNLQQAEVGTPFMGLLQVAVTDAHGAAVVGAAVSFSVVADPATGAGAGFTTGPPQVATVSSGSNGTAIAPQLVANAHPGSFQVVATVATPGVAPVRFDLTTVPQPAPVIQRLSPAAGPVWGGTEVEVSGSGFARLAPVSAVTFGGRPAPFQVDRDGAVVATAPAGDRPGPVSVEVVAGGQVSAAATFNYLAGGWVPTASMGRPRAGHTATVLDAPSCHGAARPAWCGRVLVVGGWAGVDGPRSVDGPPGAAALDSAEVYTPPSGSAPGSWSDTTPLRPTASTRVTAPVTVPAGGAFGIEVDSTSGFPMPASFVVDTALGAVRITCATATPTAFGDCQGRQGSPLAAGDVVSTADAARAGHTATALGDGRVLVAGGTDGTTATAGTEIYDPATGTWTPSAPMAQARFGHTATLLADGRVLVVGGTGPGVGGTTGPLVSAELFDPTGAGSWRAVAPLPEARSAHTASLVAGTGCAGDARPPACGRVVVAGGDGNDSFGLDTSVSYDPASDTWTQAPMPAGRAGHAAVVLADGSVLVSGGCCTSTVPFGDLDATALYDPATAAWAVATPLREARHGHSALRLDDGSVVVAGGSDQTRHLVAQAESFDPVARTWASLGDLVTARVDQAAVALPGGRVLVVGGTDGGGQRLASAELFDPRATQPPPVVGGVSPDVVGTSGGRLTISGAGFFGADVVVHVGALDVRPAATDVRDHSIVVTAPPQSRGTVNVSVTRAGTTSAPIPTGRLTYIDAGWTPTGAMASARRSHTATFIDGTRCRVPEPPVACFKVLVVDGDYTTTGAVATAELYDPGTGTWTPTAHPALARWGHSATLLPDGSVLVVGGVTGYFDQDPTDRAEVFDPSGSWSATAPMHHARFDHSATLLGDGAVLVAGGAMSSNYEPVASAEVYRDGRWTEVDDLHHPRVGHTATTLADGSVLVVGGMDMPCGAGDYRCGAAEPNGSAERYDPATRAWRPAATLPVGGERAYHSATALPDGRVLVAGGIHALHGAIAHADVIERTASAVLYDPTRDTWTPTAPLAAGRAGHTATLLGDGTVLVSGGGMPLFNVGPLDPLASAEVFDPAARAGAGTWSPALPMASARASSTATVLDGPTCRTAAAGGAIPPWCGAVLVAGGSASPLFTVSVATAELYTPGPRVRSLAPAVASVAGGTAVDVQGSGFTGAVTVRFGDTPATSVTVLSATHLVATAPGHAHGTVGVNVTTAAGSSASLEPQPAAAFSYQGTPARPQVSARATGDHGVEVRFAAVAATAGDDGGPPARLYEVRESLSPIDDPASFAAATPVCAGGPSGHACVLGPAKVGDALSVAVGDLEAGTTYYYAVAAVNDAGVAGPPSAPAAATTTGTAPSFPAPPGAKAAAGTCGPTPAPGPGQVRYPAGYSLVGGPAATVVGADSPLYGWSDAGAGGAYTTAPGTAPVVAGRGYFAWFACPHVVALAPGGASHLRLALGAYHASMVANPSASAAVRVSGFDYAARWDPALNGGAGGYHLSGFRQAEVLAVGEGMWVFSYTATTVAIDG